ncbi:DNA-binding NarL/FixJ family response regulator [Kitasatospora sp. MAP12-15]|uniref:response regulator transcription factor n=1 Tax=unclassified Kitasatospora TaxID=2633591 RepID=UPI002473F3FC|nr:response regulator transcription factor [Kitasatospora sp. MAP12-44]MDH6108513.1 DNA-binding NarL/FixJ family response regulator [Kitasatospora sp. MAP12-44]
MAGEIRVVVADRRRSVAEVLALGLRQVGMVGSAVTGMKAACRVAAELHADVVVADIGLLGRADSPQVQSPWPSRLSVPLIVLSDGSRTDDLACAAVRAGVRGWVPKDSSVQHLLAVIRGVQRGETWIPPQLLTRVLAELVTLRDGLEEDTGRLATLTTREREVLGCLSAGMSRAEIGRRLFLSTNTVRTHIQNLMIKLDVHSSVAAVALAHRVALPNALPPVDAAPNGSEASASR